METETFNQENNNHDERDGQNKQISVQQKPIEESQTVVVPNCSQPAEIAGSETQKMVQTSHQESISDKKGETVEPMEEQTSNDKKNAELKCISTFENNVLTYKLGSKSLKLALKKHSLRFTIIQSQNGAKNLDELLNPQNKNNIEDFSLTHKELLSLTSGLFKNCQSFFTFLIENLSNENMLFMKDDIIKFKLKPENENSPELKLNIKKIISKRLQSQKIQVNLNGIQDKLLQFQLKEIELIERIQRRWTKKQMNNSEISEQQPEEQSKIDQSEALYESEDDLLDDEQDQWIDVEKIKKEIDSLESQFQQFGKKFKIPVHTQLKTAEKAPSVMSMASTPSKPELNLFPPGYLPPHLLKPQSPSVAGTENMSSAQSLRYQANQTKKAKLKMAKEMLKLGYSTAEVIQRIQAQERSGKDDPNAFTPPSSRKSFLPPSAGSSYQPSVPSAPSVASHQFEKPQPTSNDRTVREMFKKLLKEKKYKKLDEIQKHMQREGIHTSVAELKKILNEIRSSNAQRQKAEKQSQAE